jgi:hypothetical protein
MSSITPKSLRAQLIIGALGLGLAMALIGCDWIGEPHQGRQFGVSITPTGDILVLYNPCVRGQELRGARLVDVEGRLFGDSNDRILWEIMAKSPIDSGMFHVGEVPTGFIEEVPLETNNLYQADLGFIVLYANSAEDFDGRQFRLSELREGLYLDAKDRYLTEEEFLELDTCRL